ncbi:MAG: CPBP family intramembrane metalloprotease [Opitutaceae bacterium]|nr:CPBP family intramembrane metalloprotease [Verrucomicrobiales bacterium]
MTSVLLTLCFGVILSSAVLHFLRNIEGMDEKFTGMILFTASFHGAAIVWIYFFLKEQGVTWNEGFGLGNAPSRALALGLGVGAVALPVVLGWNQIAAELLVRLGIKPETQEAVQRLQAGMTGGQQIYLAVVAVLLAPLVEELLFRGIIYPTVKQAGYPKVALWGTALMFGAIHANLASFLPLAVFALILTWAYERTNNLLAPMLIHGLFNAANFLFIIFNEQIQRFFD